jgi:two-component system, OmpR family, sensor histidine kinase CreC
VRLGSVLFCAYLAITAACFAYPIARLASSLRVAYLESAEEPLVDTANVLAALVGESVERETFDPDRMFEVFTETYKRRLSARIYATLKDRVDLRVYITDAEGRVIFDSQSRDTIGQDYSRWQDVRRTLRGEYGARVRRDPEDPAAPLELYVAAPVRIAGQIAGVLTVGKPTTSINAFLKSARPRLFQIVALCAAAAIALSLGVSLWVTQQVGRLTRYADDVRAGKRVAFPRLARTELRSMGHAFERMREALAGQAYVEKYVQALTHEVKSPISAIRGAAEILEDDDLDPEKRARFLRNIQNETQRIQDLVDRMLRLSELEVRSAPPARESVALAPLLRTIVESQEGALAQKGVRAELDVPEGIRVPADAFLLHLALSNLLQNAVDFSPRDAAIRVSAVADGGELEIRVDDQGPGLPDFAEARVFEKFFSLPRPDTGKKSTGLGLNFVQEVAALHDGSVRVENRASGGLRACLRLPA